MSQLNFTHLLAQTVTELSEGSSLRGLFHEHKDGDPLPSGKVLRETIELCRAILFPGFYGKSTVNQHTITYHIGVNIERLYSLLAEQIHAGLCFADEDGCNLPEYPSCDAYREKAIQLSGQFISRLPALRRVLRRILPTDTTPPDTKTMEKQLRPAAKEAVEKALAEAVKDLNK